MRIKLAVVLVLIVGAVLAVYLLLGNQTLSPLQLAQAKKACRECHGRPTFARASDVHTRHPQLGCATCHPKSPPDADLDACMVCHGKPRYASARAMHDTHAALSCSHCHRDNIGLKITDNLHNGLKWFVIGIVLFGLTALTANFIMVSRRTKTGVEMEQRTIERFRTRTIWIHWLHTASFVVLLITGALMFFHLTGMRGGHQIRTVHRIMAVFFVAAPVLYAFFDPRAAMTFLEEAFRWNRDDIQWLKLSVGYYFGGQEQIPPQDRINGDQKLWQLVVIITGSVFIVTGVSLWFFKLTIPTVLYGWVLLTHAAAFVVISLMFLLHFYLRTLHPRFDESLSSMLDGKVSAPYARKHYPKWHDSIIGGKSPS